MSGIKSLVSPGTWTAFRDAAATSLALPTTCAPARSHKCSAQMSNTYTATVCSHEVKATKIILGKTSQTRQMTFSITKGIWYAYLLIWCFAYLLCTTFDDTPLMIYSGRWYIFTCFCMTSHVMCVSAYVPISSNQPNPIKGPTGHPMTVYALAYRSSTFNCVCS